MKRINIILLILAAVFVHSVSAQTLEGQKLVKYEHSSWKLATATASFEGIVPAGQLRGAQVLLDKPDQMRVEIRYRGFEEAVLSAEVLDRKRKSIKIIEPQRVRLDGTPVVIDFQLQTESQSAQIEAGYLKITVSKNETAKGGVVSGYRLPKVWQSGSAERAPTPRETAVVTLRPVGAAGRLREGHRALPVPARNQRIASVDSKRSNLITIRPLDETVNPETSEREPDFTPRGPGPVALSIWEMLQADIDFEAPHEVINIRPEVFADRNPLSRVFYYLPAAYHIRWTRAEGYNFTVIHHQEGARMHVTLTPGVKREEIEIVRQMLESRLEGMADRPIQLRPMPLARTPVITLAGELGQQFEIPVDKVTASQSSSFFEPIRVSWETDLATKEEMKTALSARVGISGNMIMQPAGDSLAHQQIPVFLNLADERTLGKMVMEKPSWRNRTWRNPTLYPLRLTHLHALVMQPDEQGAGPMIYSWDMHDTRVEPGQAARITDQVVPSWIDRYAKRLWISYRVESCAACDTHVFRQIEQGALQAHREEISFETFNVLEKLGAEHLRIRIRSRYATPRAGIVSDVDQIRLQQDDEPQVTGPLHLPADRASGQKLFEYYLTLVMPDGTKYRALDWMPSRELEVLLGPKQIKKALGPISVLDQLP